MTQRPKQPSRRGSTSSASTNSSTPAKSAPRTRRPAEVLSEREALALIGACSGTAPTGIRNRALIAVMWRCGLRCAEALALEARDVDLDAGTLRVRHGKGDHARTVGLDATAGAMLGRWIDRRAQLGAERRTRTMRSGSAPVFCTLDGSAIDSSYVRRLLPRLAARAGIQKRVHAHGLRHSFAAELARCSTPINVIRDALGHRSLAVTDRYLRDVAPELVIRTMSERQWEAPKYELRRLGAARHDRRSSSRLSCAQARGCVRGAARA